jgi:predicted regulator of Ras-like GTPase activity (Roadblock/LC7/MglB family)
VRAGGDSVEILLGQLNAVPGVVGTFVYSADGELLAQAFPPAFEATSLRAAAQAAAEGAAGLAPATGEVRMLDLRCANTRIVARPIAGASLLFVCAPAMNLQPLAISTLVVAPRIEKLLSARSGAAEEVPRDGALAKTGGALFATVQRINAVIERKRLDAFKVRGAIAMKAGFGLGFIDEETPDDPEKLATLKSAASELLGEPI